ncbi:MAG: nucleotidyltransferase domain-containing protein [Armatimonadaceae bacterium]
MNVVDHTEPLTVTRTEIQELAAQIADKFHPVQIVLFGSHAYGTPHCWSDVDLLVVLPHTGKNRQKSLEIRDAIHVSYPVDILVKTPDELRKRIALGDFFLRDIISKGEVLYESADARMD